jgi:hypothetical protein
VTTYARMIDGQVAQIIPPIFDDKGSEVPIESRFPPEVVEQLVEYPPRAEPTPAPTHAQLWERAIAEMRALRQPILLVLDGLQSSAMALDQKDRALVIETAKQGLRDITKLDLSGLTTYDEMRAAVGAAYYTLVASLPTDIKVAFKEATQ